MRSLRIPSHIHVVHSCCSGSGRNNMYRFFEGDEKKAAVACGFFLFRQAAV